MNCELCGHLIASLGTCQQTCRYDKATGTFNVGKRCHTNCAQKHYEAHHDLKNPRSLASMAEPLAKVGQ